MKKVWAILIWGVLVFAIGTYLDKVRGMLMLGWDPVMTAVFRFAVGLVLVVLVVLAGRWLRRWMGGKGLEPGGWFVAGAVAWGLQGAYTHWMEPRRTLDLQVHDTFVVIAYVYAAVGVAVAFVVTAVVYFLYPLVTGRPMNRVMGHLHFWATLAALYVVLWMQGYDNGLNLPKGYLEYRDFQTSLAVGWAYEGMAMLLLAVQVVFVANLVGSLFWRKRVG